MSKKTILILIISLIAIWSCDKEPTGNNSDTEMQGTWLGYELEAGNDEWTYDVNEDILDISASISQEWYKGTITLNTNTIPKQIDYFVTDSIFDEAIGETALGIYKIEGDTLTFAARVPGDSERPQNYIPGNGTRVYIVVLQ
jgi:uncharacterized protein (TIGR03067 family)